MKRMCDICQSKVVNHIYNQKFVIMGNKLAHLDYQIVACQKCKFIFTINPFSEDKLANFYKANNKYAYRANLGVIPEYAKNNHLISFEFVNSYLLKKYSKMNAKKLKIIDIGCGSGYLLNLFKQNGYTNVQGVDPAIECKENARMLYDLDIITSTLGELRSNRKYDVILLASVLEHMTNLSNVMKKLRLLLKPNGVIFISTPDLDNFETVLIEPFLEFSLEHINFFGKNSTSNLFIKHGFKNVSFESNFIKGYGGFALNSLWEKHNIMTTKFDIQLISDDESKIKKYVQMSKLKLKVIDKIITKLIKNHEPIVIWGVGSLTSRLLATTNLQKTNILFFVDSNPLLQTTKINQIPILPSNRLKGNETILISSYSHAEEIKQILIKDRHHAGKIITLN